MKKVLIAVIVVVVILLIIVGKGIGTYNNIIALEEGVKAQWAQVENTYQRRFTVLIYKFWDVYEDPRLRGDDDKSMRG